MENATDVGSRTETSDQPLRQFIPRNNAETPSFKRHAPQHSPGHCLQQERMQASKNYSHTEAVTEGQLHTHNGLLAIKKNAKVSLAATWMDLEMITLSQIWKEKFSIISLTNKTGCKWTCQTPTIDLLNKFNHSVMMYMKTEWEKELIYVYVCVDHVYFISSTYRIVNELRENKIALKQTNLKQLPALFPWGLGNLYWVTHHHNLSRWGFPSGRALGVRQLGSICQKENICPVGGEPGLLWTAQ